MSSQRHPYTNFSKYVLRAPLFSIDFFKQITEDKTIDKNDIKALCRDDRIKEAIFLASPTLSSEVEKWIHNTLDQERSERVLFSVLKYLSRMSSRCTPFGLFAGTAVGEFSDQTQIELKQNYQHKRHTRFDMNYLVSLSQTITKIETIRDQLKFHPNTSLYKVGPQLRYVEYSYENTKRVHHIVGVNYSKYLKRILKSAKNGKTITQLANDLASDSIDFEDAFHFITELIENQILISELEPSVSGDDFLFHIISVLKTLNHTDKILTILNSLEQELKRIDKSVGNCISNYSKISETIKALQTEFELKYLFQTDMILSSRQNSISYSIARKILGAFNLLNKLSPRQSESSMSKFNTSFFERYETKAMPLSKALDKELGIGFEQDRNYGDVNALIDDLELPDSPETSSDYKITTNPIQDILQDKLIECIESKSEILNLKDEDFKDFETNWTDLPDTMYTMIEILEEDGEEKVFMPFLSGSSAANLLGRFCQGDKDISALAKEIALVEKQINSDKIIAEIVHLPESRVGNILFRPHLRDYEIPYLANSTLEKEKQIKIEDLEIVAQSPNHLSIRSKRLNKEVIPRLSNAHNFTIGSLPVYQFLASAQNSNQRNALAFSWGVLEQKFSRLPRVEYNGIILSPRLWNFKKSQISQLVKWSSDDSKFSEEIKELKAQNNLPHLVMLKDGDNELLINLDNLLSVKMLLSIVRKRQTFQLKEFFHTTSAIVREKNKSYSNQVVVSFFNQEKLKNVS